MKLYFSGCSHTHGDDLRSKDDAWPAVIARNLDCDYFNDSVPGGTNDRIMYRTIKHINEFDKFYVAWTYTTRFTRYRADNNFEVNFNPQLSNRYYGDDPDFQKYGSLHYRVWHNELFAFKKWLQDIVLLQNFLTSQKKAFIMINTCNNFIDRWTVAWPFFNDSVKSLLCFDLMDDIQLQNEHAEIAALIRKIDISRFIGWNQWWLIKMCEQFPLGPTNHLLEEGHRATADYILAHDTN
jgi:hypothetical protein